MDKNKQAVTEKHDFEQRYPPKVVTFLRNIKSPSF